MARTPKKIALQATETVSQPQAGIGGALEGAERTKRETILWNPSLGSPDRIINPVKQQADARGRDIALNDGYAAGAVGLQKDGIVGTQYRLNASPNWRVLGVSEAWAEEWSEIVEARFRAIADDDVYHWLDYRRRLTLTEQIRLGVSIFAMTGEVLMTSEWVTSDRLRPLRTAFQHIHPDRLSNPDGLADTERMRRGIELDERGAPLRGHIRTQHPGESFISVDGWKWKPVRFFTGWGRWQLLHIAEQRLPDQSRGISDMVAVLAKMSMLKKFSEIVLQNAVVNATYAAAIESDLPTNEVIASMGGGTENGIETALGWYMDSLSQYLRASGNIAVDGVKIPHLFPGTRLNMQLAGKPGGIGGEFEASLLRHIAAGLGVGYEELSKDYTKTNYSSARASMLGTWRSLQTKKKLVADRIATAMYVNVVEEEINNGNLPLPPGKDRSWFYEPLVRGALCECSWIGAARGQIDELKETQAAVERMNSHLSTLEDECARIGRDWRDVLRQRKREIEMMKTLGIDPVSMAPPVAAPGGPNGNNGDEPQNDGEDA